MVQWLRIHEFYIWSGKIPHVMGQQSPSVPTTEVHTPWNPCPTRREAATVRSPCTATRVAPAHYLQETRQDTTRESLCTAMKTQCSQNKEIKFKKDKAVTAPARNGEICLLGARLSGHCTTSWRGVNENTPLLSLYTAMLSLLPPLAMSGMNMLIWPMVTEDTWPQKEKGASGFCSSRNRCL